MNLKKLLLLALFPLFLAQLVQAQSTSQSVTPIIDDSIQSLEQVEQTINLLNSNIEQLNKVISSLESDSNASVLELQKQKDLRASYQSRVKQLQQRYEGLLKISEKLRKSLQLQTDLNYVLGSSLAVAVIVIVVQAVIKK